MLKDKFDELSFTTIMTDWDKSRVQLVHLGEKVIHMDNWKDGKFT
jgi:hypothetical protein